MAYKTAKNLLQNRDTYNAYYGDFRGVDFSSDHTQVHPNRLAYAVNMYKDYASAQGSCIETIPGYRRVVDVPTKETIYGIHHLFKDGEDIVLIHAGDRLFKWDAASPVGVKFTKTVELGLGVPGEAGAYYLKGIDSSGTVKIYSCIALTGDGIVETWLGNTTGWYAVGTGLQTGDRVSVTYVDEKWSIASGVYHTAYDGMNRHKSVSFVMNGKLYILDGENYLVYGGGNRASSVLNKTYVPTTRIGIISQSNEQEEQSDGVQYEQRNLLQPKFKQTFRADGKTFLFVVPVEGATLTEVRVHGKTMSKYVDYTVEENGLKGKYPRVVFTQKAPESDNTAGSVYYSAKYRGLRVEYSDYYTSENGDAFTSYQGTVDFLCDGLTKEFYLENEVERNPNVDSKWKRKLKVREVFLYGTLLEKDKDYTTGYVVGEEESAPNGAVVKFTTVPSAPEDTVAYQSSNFRKDYFGVEITASKSLDKIDGIGAIGTNETIKFPSDLITKCTIATVFDGRVFLSGNPLCPNRVFYCGRNSDGVADPSYFGEYDHFAEGSDAFAVKGLVPVADVLCVLKEESGQEGSVYYRAPTETSDNTVPKAYTGAEGIGSLGCVGACANFIDDPVFVSKRGVEAIGQLSVRYERAIEHRSSMVDAKLLNEKIDEAFLEVWNGYLLLFVDGKVYMADSRQKYADDTGIAQYEWYYLEDVGVYDGQYEAYKYASEKDESCPYEIIGEEYSYVDGAYKDLKGTIANANGEEVVLDRSYHYVEKGDHKYLCEPTGYMIGGEFKKPTCAKVIGGNLYFGTNGGHICKFNFDLRNADGELPIDAYSFDGRPILCGCATKMDNCGIPHLTKSTEKKSMVIKTKTLGASVLKIKVRTNKKPYEQVTRISSARFDFNELDFSDFSFVMSDQSLFMVREKEKKWVEKQIYLYSDEFCRPFALFYMAYRYSVTGRYKE
jgi:hypothetical protein